jgi:hypothetical protein
MPRCAMRGIVSAISRAATPTRKTTDEAAERLGAAGLLGRIVAV